MKTFFSYFLFLIFALRPVYNIGCFAYYELNVDYIIEKYCVNKEKPELQCNGKCHLADKLAISTSTNTEDSPYLATFFEAFFPVYFEKYNSNFDICLFKYSIKNNWKYNNQFSSAFVQNLDPPPKV